MLRSERGTEVPTDRAKFHIVDARHTPILDKGIVHPRPVLHGDVGVQAFA